MQPSISKGKVIDIPGSPHLLGGGSKALEYKNEILARLI
jgi:hypothetical protein